MKTARHMHMLMFGRGGGGVNMLSKGGTSSAVVTVPSGCIQCSHTFNNNFTLIGDDLGAQ